MDTTPEYVRMCEKATEIQQVSSRTAVNGSPAHFPVVNPIEHGIIIVDGNGDWWKLTKDMTEQWQGINTIARLETDIWLPRQDQLQMGYIASLAGAVYNWSDVFDVFNDFARRKYIWGNTYKEQWGSPEQYWLGFVMLKLYHKIWNGKDWTDESPHP